MIAGPQTYVRTARGSRGKRWGAPMEKPLFDKYGGFSVVSRIVLDLYNRLLDDDDVGPFFDEIDMRRVVDHQTKFVSSLMGGPASYSDDQIRKMHDHLAIGPEHFEKLREILSQTLRDHGLADEDVAYVVAQFERRRGLVVE